MRGKTSHWILIYLRITTISTLHQTKLSINLSGSVTLPTLTLLLRVQCERNLSLRHKVTDKLQEKLNINLLFYRKSNERAICSRETSYLWTAAEINKQVYLLFVV